jgi:ABC-type glycerol-3-phosphate transport system substrate-binding protein
MMVGNILKKTLILLIGSIVGVLTLLFVLSQFINVNVDNMGGNTIYPPYPFIQETSLMTEDYRFSAEEITENGSLFPLYDDDKGYDSRVIFWEEDISNEIEFTIDIEQSDTYYISLDFLSEDDSVKPDEISISINGIKEDKHQNIRLLTSWARDEQELVFDAYKNQVYEQNEPFLIWKEMLLRDQLFLDAYPIAFTFDEGLNTIKITREQGEFYIGDIRLYKASSYRSYDSYLDVTNSEDVSDELITLEAEQYTFKNSISMIPEMVKSPSVSPFASEKNYLNIMGNTFNEVGDQLTYYFNVEKSGYYYITFKYRNSFFENRDSFRNIYINNTIPFEDMNGYAFSYASGWENETLRNEDQLYKFYFNQGLNSLTIEADISAYKEDYLQIQEIIDQISAYSIDLKKLTGGETDQNREWDIASFMPETQGLFDGWYEELSNIYNRLTMMSSNQRQSTEMLKQLELGLNKLEVLKSDIDKIPHRTFMLSTGSNSLSQILSLVNAQIINQPLSLDKIYIHSADEKVPKANASFIKEWIADFQIYQTASSFELDDDYDIEVWVNRSRYYISMMQQMTDATFTEETGIKVKYAVMPNEQKLILANAANTQPDMALGVSAWLPYELGLRGAATDLRQFEGFEDVIGNLMPGSFLNMIHDQKVFGLPETQDFTVTYYRKDIMSALNLDVPQTYDEIKQILPTLQRYGMNYYLPLSSDSALKSFATTAPFIYQFGSNLYSQDGYDVLIDNEASLEGINTMVDLYTIYSLPLQTPNFYNAFREASIPIGVSNFNTYVQLTFAAPEISTQWDLALAPGYEIEPGVINRDYTGAAQASLIFEKSDKKEEAWELLKWWMSTETQTEFIYNLLVTYGDGFLWNSANINAFRTLPIPDEHIDIILEQWQHLREVPKVPGGYKLERELSNVWNRAVFDGVDVRSAVDDAIVLIDRELERKYKEFGYIDQDGNKIRPYIITTKEDVISWMEDD